jgi:primosomal protein N' (replication factor Y)
VVATDADGLLFDTSYRAAEECLRILVRLAGKVLASSGRRMMVQTSEPDHPVMVALRRGDPISFLTDELAARERFGLPPAAEILIVERRGGQAGQGDDDLREAAAGLSVMGPAMVGEGERWLIRGNDLNPFRTRIRPIVQRWRDTGATIRIDADPIEF